METAQVVIFKFLFLILKSRKKKPDPNKL